MLSPWKKGYDKPRQSIKQRYHFANKGPYTQSYRLSSSHVWMWKLDHKKGWAPKNWCFQIVVLEKTLESPLDCKEVKPVNPKGNQSWIFIGRTNDEVEPLILLSPDVKSQFTGKDHLLGKVKVKSEVDQSCLTLCNPMDCSLPGSSVHGIFQTRILEWVSLSVFIAGEDWKAIEEGGRGWDG